MMTDCETQGIERKSQVDNGLSNGSVEMNDDENCRITNLESGTVESSWRRCCFVSMWPFTAYYGFVGLVTSALVTYLTSQVTTLEKQFGLSSSETGLLMSMNDIGFLITIVFVAYFGRNSHIPRVLGICSFLYGVSALICTVPHLFTDNSLLASGNTTSTTEDQLCLVGLSNPPPPTEECSSNEKGFYSSTKTVAMTFIASGMLLQGLAKSPRYPFLQTYVDDNVPKVKSGFYIGIFFALSVCGPALSFAIGGAISRIYVTLEETDMNERDPRWVGAWWLGFLIFGSLAIVLSFPVCLFPKSLSTAPKDQQNAAQDKETTKEPMSVKRIVKTVNGLFPALKRLATNPVYAFFAIGIGIRMFQVAGMVAFLPKYMQVHYGLSILTSNLIVGFVSLGSSAAAGFIGGILTRKFRLELNGCLKLIIFVQVISSITALIGIFLACPQPEIEGFKITSPTTVLRTISTDNSTSCSAGCNCDDTKFFPVCGSNGLSYFSPCQAGCQEKTPQGYAECLCVHNNGSGPNSPAADASPGMCQTDCSLYVAFTVIMFLTSFGGALSAIPGVLVSLRSVESRDKSLALGVTSFSSSLLGFTLSPIVMGRVIDTTCILWDTSCSREGSCAVYDIADFRYKLHGIDAGVSLVYIGCFVLSYIFLLRGGEGKPYVANREQPDKELKVKT